MKKLTILVYNDISEALVNWLKSEFDVNVLKYGEKPDARYQELNVDLIVCHGEQSGNVCPDMYSENVGKHTNVVDRHWDKYEQLFYLAQRLSVPVVGFEEGAHFLSVKAGAKLIQHVTGQSSHRKLDGRIFSGDAGSIKKSNLTQLMFPYELPKSKYDVLAWNTFFQSDTYLNGKNEETDLPTDFVEAEVVKYSYPGLQLLAIQGNIIDYDMTAKTRLNKLMLNLLKK